MHKKKVEIDVMTVEVIVVNDVMIVETVDVTEISEMIDDQRHKLTILH